MTNEQFDKIKEKYLNHPEYKNVKNGLYKHNDSASKECKDESWKLFFVVLREESEELRNILDYALEHFDEIDVCDYTTRLDELKHICVM